MTPNTIIITTDANGRVDTIRRGIMSNREAGRVLRDAAEQIDPDEDSETVRIRFEPLADVDPHASANDTANDPGEDPRI